MDPLVTWSDQQVHDDSHRRLATQPTPTQKPTAVPIPDATAINRMRVTGLRQKPRRVCTSSGKRSQSTTFGLRRHASTTPTTMPVPSSGWIAAIGATSSADRTEKIDPPASSVSPAAPIDVGRIHASIISAKLVVPLHFQP